jgi:hypothetical protein
VAEEARRFLNEPRSSRVLPQRAALLPILRLTDLQMNGPNACSA